jgi:hypothetical protein
VGVELCEQYRGVARGAVSVERWKDFTRVTQKTRG